MTTEPSPDQRCTLCGHREDQHDTLPDGSRPCRSIGHSKGLTCRECRRLTSTEHVNAVMEMRGESTEAFQVAWAAYSATLDHVRKEIGSGWQAFFTDVHQSALASALIAYQEQQHPISSHTYEGSGPDSPCTADLFGQQCGGRWDRHTLREEATSA